MSIPLRDILGAFCILKCLFRYLYGPWIDVIVVSQLPWSSIWTWQYLQLESIVMKMGASPYDFRRATTCSLWYPSLMVKAPGFLWSIKKRSKACISVWNTFELPPFDFAGSGSLFITFWWFHRLQCVFIRYCKVKGRIDGRYVQQGKCNVVLDHVDSSLTPVSHMLKLCKVVQNVLTFPDILCACFDVASPVGIKLIISDYFTFILPVRLVTSQLFLALLDGGYGSRKDVFSPSFISRGDASSLAHIDFTAW